jgi:hypothetical protein
VCSAACNVAVVRIGFGVMSDFSGGVFLVSGANACRVILLCSMRL